MFDLLLQEVAKKFGLGNKASWILSTLLSLIFNRSKGGMSGFLEKLTAGGLGKIVNSWVGQGEPMAVNPTQIESAIGSGVISNLASKLGLASGPVGMAIAHMLPKVISALTPDGVIPDSIPSGIAQYMKDDEVETTTSTVETTATREQVVNHTQENYTRVSEEETEGSGFRWWWLLLPLFLLLGWCTLNQPSSTTEESAVVSDPAAPTTQVSKINPTLSISNEADNFNVSGTVTDNATKQSIFDSLSSLVGSDKISGDITVDPNADSAGWLTKIPGIISLLKGAPGAKLNFDGNDISLSGDMEQGVIDGLMQKLKEMFGENGFNLTSQAVVSGAVDAAQNAVSAPIEATQDTIETSANTAQETVETSVDATQEAVNTPVEASQDTANEAIDSGSRELQDMVATGNVTGKSLVNALNIAGINFATGSFKITSGSMAVLTNAAQAINASPADTQIQVAGHTDNTGSSEINTKLSKQRAQAVVDALVGMDVSASQLSAEGYGDSQPIADNSTEEGRTKNRRMEFTLQ